LDGDGSRSQDKPGFEGAELQLVLFLATSEVVGMSFADVVYEADTIGEVLRASKSASKR
jgi:hypothetical protein